jgi:nucleoside-diphosphate-sugar epimerase
MEVWRGIEQGLNAVIVNPSVIIGPCRWDTGSGQIFGTIAKGFPFYTLGISGYVDVRDVVSAMICATEKKLWGKRFLINGENLSHRTVFNIIAKELGKNPPRIYAKPWMTSIAWRIAWFSSLFTRKTPAINRDTAQSGHSITYYSSNRALEELGIIFHSIADAIKNTVNVGSL